MFYFLYLSNLRKAKIEITMTTLIIILNFKRKSHDKPKKIFY